MTIQSFWFGSIDSGLTVGSRILKMNKTNRKHTYETSSYAVPNNGVYTFNDGNNISTCAYLHSEVVNETYPSARVLEEHVDPLLERLALALVEHVLGLERLVDGQVNGIVRVRDAGRRGRLGVADASAASAAGGHHLYDGRVVRVAAGRRWPGERVVPRLPALLQRRGHAPVVRLAEPGHTPLVVRRRPDLPVVRRRGFLSSAPLPLQLIVAVLLRASRRRAARVAASRPLFQFVQPELVATAATAATAVTPQRHLARLAKQLHLLGAVHVDAERPRQHPAAAVRMALCVNGTRTDAFTAHERRGHPAQSCRRPRRRWRRLMCC